MANDYSVSFVLTVSNSGSTDDELKCCLQLANTQSLARLLNEKNQKGPRHPSEVKCEVKNLIVKGS
jgi:hypothetical protein